MATDPNECREQAKRCLKLAAETNDPVLGHALKVYASCHARFGGRRSQGLTKYAARGASCFTGLVRCDAEL